MIRKLLLGIMTLSLCISCVDRKIVTEEQLEKDRYERLHIQTEQNSYSEIDLEKFTYQGHQYLFFDKGMGDNIRSGIVHNPECIKCKENEQRTTEELCTKE